MVEKHVVCKKYYEIFDLVWQFLNGFNNALSFISLKSEIMIIHICIALEQALDILPRLFNFKETKKLEKS